MLAALGGSDTMVRLIRHHQKPDADQLAQALYEADEAN
jgi:hypothetical protein